MNTQKIQNSSCSLVEMTVTLLDDGDWNDYGKMVYNAISDEGKTYTVVLSKPPFLTWIQLNPGTILKVKGLLFDETTLRPTHYEVVE